MTVTDPRALAAAVTDDDAIPTPGQQAMAEQRLAEMLADPNLGDSFESLDAFLAHLTV